MRAGAGSISFHKRLKLLGVLSRAHEGRGSDRGLGAEVFAEFRPDAVS